MDNRLLMSDVEFRDLKEELSEVGSECANEAEIKRAFQDIRDEVGDEADIEVELSDLEDILTEDRNARIAAVDIARRLIREVEELRR